MQEYLQIMGIATIFTSVIILITSFIIFLLKNYLIEKIKTSVKNEYDKELEKFKAEIRNSDIQKKDKWDIKRGACLQALDLADNALSNFSWNNLPANSMVKGKIDTIEARKIYNLLATSCDSDRVINITKSIILGEDGEGKGIDLSIIVDLRNAVRKELGFGEIIDKDKKIAFFVRVHGQQ